MSVNNTTFDVTKKSTDIEIGIGIIVVVLFLCVCACFCRTTKFIQDEATSCNVSSANTVEYRVDDTFQTV